MAMTYGELANELKGLTQEQLNMTVTVYVEGVGEFYPVVSDYPLVITDSNAVDTAPRAYDDVLDNGHPYLVI